MMRYLPKNSVIALLALLAGTAPANARDYDCSKPGNANKAVCKAIKQEHPVTTTGATIPPVAAAASAPDAVSGSGRHYDCSKPGNANKAICKGQAAPLSKASPPALTAKPAAAARHYDCSKAGNANKLACKGQSANAVVLPSANSSQPPRSTRAQPTSEATHAPLSTRSTPSPAPTRTQAAGPDGASAQCKDGTYSHSARRAGTCSHHRGVATWY